MHVNRMGKVGPGSVPSLIMRGNRQCLDIKIKVFTKQTSFLEMQVQK